MPLLITPVELFGVSRRMRVTERATVRFVLDEQIVELDDVPPTLTVLDYLRETRGSHGHEGRLCRGRLRGLHRRAG